MSEHISEQNVFVADDPQEDLSEDVGICDSSEPIADDLEEVEKEARSVVSDSKPSQEIQNSEQSYSDIEVENIER
jgi:hypothetical protein